MALRIPWISGIVGYSCHHKRRMDRRFMVSVDLLVYLFYSQEKEGIGSSEFRFNASSSDLSRIRLLADREDEKSKGQGRLPIEDCGLQIADCRMKTGQDKHNKKGRRYSRMKRIYADRQICTDLLPIASNCFYSLFLCLLL